MLRVSCMVFLFLGFVLSCLFRLLVTPFFGMPGWPFLYESETPEWKIHKERTMSKLPVRFARACWRLGSAAALVAVMLLVFQTPPADAAAPDRASLSIQTVCFTVHNTGDPLPSTLYGLRYTYGRPKKSTPAIVLVHGIASSTANWDFTPSWSVARRLALAGFVVISYDRLGFAKSHYDRPKGGDLLLTTNQRDILHQVVGEVKTANYTIAQE